MNLNATAMAFRSLALVLASARSIALLGPEAYDVSFRECNNCNSSSTTIPARALPPDHITVTPTPFDGNFYADGMPTGNGITVVLAWGNASNGGLDFYVRSPLAMHTDSQLFTLAKVSIALSPNPFVNSLSGGYWNQSHRLEDGTITVSGGGSGGLANAAANLTLLVDANAQVRALRHDTCNCGGCSRNDG